MLAGEETTGQSRGVSGVMDRYLLPLTTHPEGWGHHTPFTDRQQEAWRDDGTC